LVNVHLLWPLLFLLMFCLIFFPLAIAKMKGRLVK
jgi:hypothetical protein